MPRGEEPVRVWEEEEPWGPYIVNAIKAQHLFKKDVDYIVDSEDHVKIINRSTGRVQARSRWVDNIHQACYMLLYHTWYASCALSSGEKVRMCEPALL